MISFSCGCQLPPAPWQSQQPPSGVFLSKWALFRWAAVPFTSDSTPRAGSRENSRPR